MQAMQLLLVMTPS